MMIDHKVSILNPKKSPYIEYIRQGLKHAEGRIFSQKFQKLKVGENICLHDNKEGIICKVIFMHTYKSFREMLEAEGADKMLPQLLKLKISNKQKIELGIKIYEGFPNSSRIKIFRCIAIGVKYLTDNNIKD